MVRSILAALGAAAVVAVGTAIVFAILDLYLSGHGRPSPTQQPFLMRGPVQLSVADAALLVVSALAGATAFLWTWRRR